MTPFFRRLRYALGHSRHDADLREEIEAHRAMRQDALERDGLAGEDAVQASRRALGNVLLAVDDARDVWTIRTVDSVWLDLRAALHGLRHGKGMLVTAGILTGIGIGANALTFSLLKATQLPFPELDRIFVVEMTPPDGGAAVAELSVPEYLALRQKNEAFSDVGALLEWPYNLGALRDGDPAERLSGFRYTDTIFPILGVQPEVGRGFTADENVIDAAGASVIISHRLWRTRYNSNPAIVGETVRIDDAPLTIVGVMPDGFKLFGDAQVSELWTPLPFNRQQVNSTLRFVTVLAKLKPGVSRQQAQANLDAVATVLGQERPQANGGWRMTLQPLNELYFGGVRRLLFILQAAAILILLIACANVAGLLLIRLSSRRLEIATRYALGGTRSRLISLLLSETMIMSLLGGIVGLALAAAGLRVLDGLDISWLSRLPALTLDPMNVLFAMGIAVATGVACGLSPAFYGSRTDLSSVLRTSRGVGNAHARWLQRALVGTQIGVALVLLIGAGLLIQNVLRLETASLGAEPEGVFAFEARLANNRYQRRIGNYRGFTLLEASPIPAQIFDRVQRRVRDIPGIESVAGINISPFAAAPDAPLAIEGRNPLVSSDTNPEFATTRARHYMVTPDYFRTMRIPVRSGRDFAGSDQVDDPWVAIINEEAARRYWPNESPIGRRVMLELSADEQPREIVGIVGDVTFNLQDRTATPTIYTTRVQQPLHSLATFGQRTAMTYVVRLTAPADSVLPVLRRAVAEVDPQIPMAQPQPLEIGLAEQIQTPRFYMWFVGAFAVIALLLATLGLYGVISYTVAQRSRELALRVALGAQAGAVATLILREAILLAVAGLVAGCVAALALTRFLRAVLWEIAPTDVPTFAGVALLLAAIVIGAALIPTRRALRANPRAVLMEE